MNIKNITGDRKKLVSAIGYLFFFVPFLMKNETKDDSVRFHAYQALGLFMAATLLKGLLGVVGGIITGIPAILIVTPSRALLLAGAIMGIINVEKGRIKLLPYIGRYVVKLFA